MHKQTQASDPDYKFTHLFADIAACHREEMETLGQPFLDGATFVAKLHFAKQG